MHTPTITLLALLALSTDVALAQTEPSSPVRTWVSQPDSRWAFRDPSDPLSARATAALTGPEYGVFDHDAAVVDLVNDMELTLAKGMELVPVPAWRRLNGSDLRAGITDTTIGNAPAVVFMTVKQPKGSANFELYALVMQRETFVAWGGIVWLMADAGLVPGTDVFSPDRQRQIATAPYGRQLALFVEAASLKVDILARQLNDQLTQQMLTNQLIDLNLDLMFGDLAVSPVAD